MKRSDISNLLIWEMNETHNCYVIKDVVGRKNGVPSYSIDLVRFGLPEELDTYVYLKTNHGNTPMVMKKYKYDKLLVKEKIMLSAV